MFVRPAWLHLKENLKIVPKVLTVLRGNAIMIKNEAIVKGNENLVGSGKWGVERKRKKKKKRSAISERMRAWESSR